MSIRKKLKELRKVARLHVDWLSFVLLQDDSNEEELRKYGKLPMDKSIDLVKYAHKLGQLRMSLKQKEYKDLKFSDLEKAVEKEPLSAPEHATVEQGRMAADDGIREIVGSMMKAALRAISARITSHSVSGESNVEQALADDPAVKKLLGSLGSNILSEYTKEWERQLYTEVQVSKNRGAVQAIVQKKGPYAGSDGIDSRVSIVPRPNACEDCVHHYMDGKNPRIFVLRDLIEAGTNADPGVKHTRKNGIHNHWKSTLSPLHLGCGCRIQYLPPGTSWEDGKMVVHSEDAFKKGLFGFGANKDEPSSEAPSPPSTKGNPAPGNTPGPGRPSTGVTPGVEYDYVPMKDGKPEGPGWKATESGMSYKRPKGMAGAKGGKLTDEHKKVMANAEVDDAKKWHANDKPDSVVMEHITSGKITTKKDLSQDPNESSGVNTTYRVTIEGNGRAAMKPPVARDPEMVRQGIVFGAGTGSVPEGTEHHREAAVYQVSALLGGMGGVPPTVVRSHQGQPMSFQSWKENTSVSTEAIPNDDRSLQSHENVVNNAPPHAREAVRQKLQDIAVMDMVTNNGDRHFDNITIADDGSDVFAIDHGHSVGSGLLGHRGDIHMSFHNAGDPVKLSDTVKTRLDSTSYGDYKRAMASSGVEDWAVAQTFMRSRYVSHLQETEGHLDYEKFRGSMTNGRGQSLPLPGVWGQKSQSADIPEGMPSQEFTDREYINAIAGNPNSDMIDQMVQNRAVSKAGAVEFIRRENAGHLPDQMLNSWGKHFLEGAAADSSHKDHSAAKEILEMGPFMGGNFHRDGEKYRKNNAHKLYQSKIEAKPPPAQVGRHKPLAGTEPGTMEIGSKDIESVDTGTMELGSKDIESVPQSTVKKGLTYVGEE